MEFRPCIDLHKGKVKQIVGSTINKENENVIENFVSSHDSTYYAQMFKKDELFGGHIIMLGQGNEEQAMRALKAYPHGLQIGGGITDENAIKYIDAGASHIIITSYVFKNGQINMDKLKKISTLVGKEHLVLDLSCKKRDGKYYVTTNMWTEFTEFEVNEKNLDMLGEYCSEFLVHAVDVEGKRSGIIEELVVLLSEYCKIPVTYAGGVKNFEDVKKIKALGKNKVNVTVGSGLDIFGGDISYKEVVDYQKKILK